jgi:hypothetical protein
MRALQGGVQGAALDLLTAGGEPREYVVEQLYVDLIERYAQVGGVEPKAVVNLTLHEFFERRHYLPEEEV